MNRLILTALLAAFALPVSAQTIAGSNSESSSTSQSASGSQSNNANNVNIISSAPELQRISGDYASSERVNVTGQQHFKTNTPVMLTSAVSYSSDLCISTSSAGASAAGISIGGSKGVNDANCEALRRAEKFGNAAVTAFNTNLKDRAFDLQAMLWFEICTTNAKTAAGCLERGLITQKDMALVTDPHPVDTRRKR